MEVETALPHRHDLWLAEQRLHPVDAVLGVVGVHAHRRPDAVSRVPAGDLDVVGRLADVAAHRDQALHPRRPRGHGLIG